MFKVQRLMILSYSDSKSGNYTQVQENYTQVPETVISSYEVGAIHTLNRYEEYLRNSILLGEIQNILHIPIYKNEECIHTILKCKSKCKTQSIQKHKMYKPHSYHL